MHQVLQKPGVIYNVEVKGRYSGAISLVYTLRLDYGVIVTFVAVHCLKRRLLSFVSHVPPFREH